MSVITTIAKRELVAYFTSPVAYVFLVIFLLLSGRHPEMKAELPALWRSAALFTALTAASGASLFGFLRELKWRWAALFATLLLIAGMAAFYVRP